MLAKIEITEEKKVIEWKTIDGKYSPTVPQGLIKILKVFHKTDHNLGFNIILQAFLGV
jgi:hypothetical protein